MPLRRRHVWRGTFCSAGVILALASCSGNASSPELIDSDEPGAITGELIVYIADYEDGIAETSYFLRDARGSERRLHFSTEPDLAPRTSIRVWGDGQTSETIEVVKYALASNTHPGSLGSQSAQLIGETPPPRILCSVLVTLNGGAIPQNLGMTDLETQFHTGPTSVNAYYIENSYGGASLGGKSYGPFDYAFSGCDTTGLANAIRPMILDRCDQYAFLMVPHTTSCTWAGLGQVGTAARPAADTWYNGTLGCVATVQEPGHNYGLNHSSSITCPAAPFLDNLSTCTHSEYGDRFDTMGVGCRHMNVWQKQYQGWFGKCNAIKVGTSGTFNLLPTEMPCDGVQSMQLPFPGGKTRAWQGVTLTSYYLELRTSMGFDMGMTPQVLIHTGTDPVSGGTRAAPHTWIINASGNVNNPGLVANGTFSDPVGGLTITVTSLTTDAATVAVNYATPSGGATCLDGAMLTAPGPTTCAAPLDTDGGVPAPPADAGGDAGDAGTDGSAGRDAVGGMAGSGTDGAAGSPGVDGTGAGGSGGGGSGAGGAGGGGAGAGGLSVDGAADADTSTGTGGATGSTGSTSGTGVGGADLTGSSTSSGGPAGASGTSDPTSTTSSTSGSSGHSTGTTNRATGSASNDALGSCTCRIGGHPSRGRGNGRMAGLLGLGLAVLLRSRRRARPVGA